MDCVEERALKSKLRREASTKDSQQFFIEDVFSFNGGNEEFSVDDLLDLSGEQFDDLIEDEKDSVSVSSRVDDDSLNSNAEIEVRSVESIPSVPIDDWKDLEWLSKFVDDSGSEFSLLCPVQRTGFRPYRFKPVNRKARSTRRRVVSTWFSVLPFILEKPRVKRRRVVEPVQRRCSHCLVQKTPQWRTGPLGAKTLCNACGVRFKSGRLFPEYRPACSPTFSGDVHSNSHRKVLELRRRKDVLGDGVVRSEPAMVESV